MSSAPVPSRPGLRLVGGDEPLADVSPRRSPAAFDRRAAEVARENRLAAHVSGSVGMQAAQIDARDPRWVLAMQTQARLQGAVLAPERRDELLKSGRQLGLRAFEANLVIAVVQDRARTNQPVRLTQPTLALIGHEDQSTSVSSRPATRFHRAATLAQWFIAGALAALMATAVIRWLASAPS